MFNIKTYESDEEKKIKVELIKLFQTSPIPLNQILSNLGLFINSKDMSRILFMDYIYKKIIDVQGIVIDFGCHWGHNAALFSTFRGIYEPFNRHRKIVAFDTFQGFPEITLEDGNSDLMKEGNLALPDKYEEYLKLLLELKELFNPASHIQKFEVIKGNAVTTFEEYLRNNPETIVSLAYFDFDIYLPTFECLKLIKDRIVKGSIIAFDELNDPDSPGETQALIDVFGLPNVKLKRHPNTSRVSYFIYGE